MIGNDIVDLQLARTQSNWQRTRFVEKIFTNEEQDYIRQSENSELEVWKLWTIKESAYKIYNRETGIRGFFPWKLECEIEGFRDNKFVGKVSIDAKVYFTETIQDGDFIYTVAANSLQLIEKIIEIDLEEKIVKINGLPFITISKKPVSITHHGRFERRISLMDDC